MKVSELMQALKDKDPWDDVMVEVTVQLRNEHDVLISVDKKCAEVNGILPGNTPVVIEAKATVSVESKVTVY